jgi:hypothetical protein
MFIADTGLFSEYEIIIYKKVISWLDEITRMTDFTLVDYFVMREAVVK